MRTDDGNALTVKHISLEGMRPLGGWISEVDRIIAHEVTFRKADGRSIQFESLVISKPDLTTVERPQAHGWYEMFSRIEFDTVEATRIEMHLEHADSFTMDRLSIREMRGGKLASVDIADLVILGAPTPSGRPYALTMRRFAWAGLALDRLANEETAEADRMTQANRGALVLTPRTNIAPFDSMSVGELAIEINGVPLITLSALSVKAPSPQGDLDQTIQSSILDLAIDRRIDRVLQRTLDKLGYERVVLSGDATFNTSTNLRILTGLITVTAEDMGMLRLTLVIELNDGDFFGKTWSASLSSALGSIKIQSFDLSFGDRGLVDHVVTTWARQKYEDRAEALAELEHAISDSGAQEIDRSENPLPRLSADLRRALTILLRRPGEIEVSANPTQPVSIADAAAIDPMDLQAAQHLLGISIAAH
jgi:hypothetical protein